MTQIICKILRPTSTVCQNKRRTQMTAVLTKADPLSSVHTLSKLIERIEDKLSHIRGPVTTLTCHLLSATDCCSAARVYALHCTLHTAQCTLYTEHCTLHTEQCTLNTAQCTVHTAHCTVHSAQCALHSVHSAQCTLHTAQCTVHTEQCCTQ